MLRRLPLWRIEGKLATPNVVYMSESDFTRIFRPSFAPRRDGWKTFYERFPDSHGIIKFSRVAFLRGADQAIVYVQWAGHWVAGDDGYYLLRRVNGKWRVVDYLCTGCA